MPYFGFTGKLTLSLIGLSAVLLLGIWMFYHAVVLYKKRDVISAKKLMLVSVTYITLLQIIYVIDKFS